MSTIPAWRKLTGLTSSPRVRGGIATLLAILVLFIAYVAWAKIGKPLDESGRENCRNTLKHVYVGIQRHIEEYRDLPRDSDGSFSLDVLTTAFEDQIRFRACMGSLSQSYETNPSISIEDFFAPKDTKSLVVACDRPENHQLRYANGMRFTQNGEQQIEANLLLANGNRLVWYGNLADYQKWFDEFSAGAFDSHPPGITDEQLQVRAEPSE